MYRILKVLTETESVYIVQYKVKFLWWSWWVTAHDRRGDNRKFTYLSEAENYVKSKMEGPKVVRTFDIPPKEC